jgi:hypothetical protein
MVAQELMVAEGHRHITDWMAKFHANTLDKAVRSEKSVDELFWPVRLLNDYVFQQRSNCHTCYKIFARHYYGANEQQPK